MKRKFFNKLFKCLDTTKRKRSKNYSSHKRYECHESHDK